MLIDLAITMVLALIKTARTAGLRINAGYKIPAATGIAITLYSTALPRFYTILNEKSAGHFLSRC